MLYFDLTNIGKYKQYIRKTTQKVSNFFNHFIRVVGGLGCCRAKLNVLQIVCRQSALALQLF
jgi:hypothetical protein